MPDIKNTFLKAKMNKDLDDRLVPSGEYRDAQNLQISRSEGSDVGEFENIKGTNLEARLYTGYDDGSVAPNLDLGYNAQVIGSFSDDTNSTLYFMSTAWEGVGICPRDITVYSTAVVAGATTIQLDDALGNLLDPQVLGIEIGMLVQDPTGVYGDPDPLVIEVTATNITISQGITLGIGDEIVIGWANMIHSWDTSNSVLTLLVRGAFLNFNKNFPIHGINKMEELLFWTDNNNQPRRINITQANPANIYWPQYYTNEDQISVAKYYPFETPLVFDRTIQLCNSGIIATAPLLGYILTMNDPTGIESGDLVTGLTDQTDEELWEVINITGNDVTIYNNFLEQPLNPVATLNLSFSRPTMTNESNKLADNGFVTTLDSLGAGVITGGSVVQLVYNFDNATTGGPQPTPVPGDLITSDDLNISISDDIKIQSIDTITPGIPGIIIITLTKDITVVTGTEELRVSANPSYDSLFKGDPDLIEEKFVRFSYRFKYVDNEYSLSAPFTQICYIPKQYGFFGMGPNPTEQDMIDAYTSTVLAWFENRIDNIGLQIPFPLGGTDIATATTSLINDYQIKEIDILYKESESLITRIVDTIPVSNAASFTDYVKAIPSGAGGSTTEFYFTYDYKSIKPYKTLPQSQTTRVYDNVPVKALGQELIANRVVYGNYLEGHTPPISMDYGVFRADKSINYDNYIQYPNHTLKQNRNYQVGWILGDRYGRQSSVILSVNDDVPNVDGSTIYVPYKLWEEVSDIPGTLGGNDVSTYEWLGSVLRLRLNNGITPVVSSPITGEPGLYKAYEDTGADRITLINPGTGYVLGICDALYDEPIVGEGPGLGTGLEVEITSETGGVITGIRIVTPGTGFVDGQLLLVKCGGTDAIIQVTVYPPNLLGWLSYKIAIKQQEQEYYNVYLPGFIAGYPVIEQTAAGKLALTAVFSDNINKLPRDLQEVGPLDTEFAASVNLYGRVNNPDINNLNGGAGVGPYWSLRDTAWNCQYFPGRFKDEVITVAPVGTGGLEVANVPFTVGATSGGTAIQGAYSNTSSINEAITVPQVAWGEPGALSSVFNIDQNPLSGVLTVGVQESQPNLNPDILATLGARVSEFSLPASPEILCMTPYLSISETEPVETNLELFYETSTCGNFVTLNDEVRLSFTGVDAVTETTGDFYESDIIGASAVNGFSFVDADGTVQPSAVPEITSIVDNNSNSYPVDPANPACPFALDDLGGGIWNLELNILPVDFNITPSMPPVPPPNAIRNYTISYLVSLPTIDGPLLTTLSNAQIVDLLNYRPNVTGFEESAATTNPGNIAAPGDTINVTNPPAITTVFGDFKGDNGSTSGAQTNLTWELGKTVIPDYGEIWSVDCTTGALSWDSTVPLQVPPKPDTLYEFFVAPKDCATCVPAAACCPVTTTDSLTGAGTFKIQFGTPSTPRAICSGGDGYPFVCRQTPTNVSSLDYMAATPAPINQDPYTVPSGIVWSGACVATGYYTGGSSGWYAGTAGTGGLANGGGNTTPNAGANPGHPAEFYFGGTTGYNNAVTTGTQAYFTATPAYATYVAANSGGGIVGEDPWGTGNPYSAGLAFYNVAQRTTYNPAICPAPIPPAINSAALDKGTLAINIKLLRVGATAVDNATTDYTIIHRPPSGVWQPAVPSAIANGDPADSPTSPGVAIPATTTLTTAAAGSTINCFLYYFDEPGEYAVRNNGITGLGATTEPQCHAFQVDFWDAHEGASASGLIGGLCANCTGS